MRDFDQHYLENYYDFVVIGSGFGGGPLAHTVSQAGLRTLLVERGSRVLNNDPQSLQRVRSDDNWYHRDRRLRNPVSYYCLGGMSKFFGGHLTRMRESDFRRIEHEHGVSPEWPIQYKDLEKYYSAAEKLFQVYGCQTHDVSAPFRSTDYPHSPPPMSNNMSRIVSRLRESGVSPFPQSLCLNREAVAKGNCDGCNARYCTSRCKYDVENACILPIAKSGHVDIWTNAKAVKLVTNSDGDKIEYVIIKKGTQIHRVYSKQFIVSCGAINSCVLLLESKSSQHPFGLANSSRLIGRNYMQHYNTELIAISRKKLSLGSLHKSFSINDFYEGGGTSRFPLGNLQCSGTVTAKTLQNSVVDAGAWVRRLPPALLSTALDHVLVVSAISEDLPDVRNRVTLRADGSVIFERDFVHLAAHQQLIKSARALLRRVGFDAVIPMRLGVGQSAHYCGTLRFGEKPSESVLNPFCRTHDVNNLYVVDASFFPSSSAMNPSLTIAAQSLRVAQHLVGLARRAVSR